MPKKKRNPKHKYYLKYVLIWYLIAIIIIASLYALPLTRSIYSFAKILIVYIPLSLIGAISLIASLQKSFKKNIIYVYVIFILLISAPIITILTNVIFVKLDEDRTNIFQPYNFSCSMYHKQNDFDKWWKNNSYWYEDFNITKDMFETFPLKNGFSSEDLRLKIAIVSLEDINIGDIGLYKNEDDKRLIAHRVIGKEYTGNITYILLNGDNNRRYYEGIREENVYGKLEETYRSKLFTFFARDGCHDKASMG